METISTFAPPFSTMRTQYHNTEQEPYLDTEGRRLPGELPPRSQHSADYIGSLSYAETAALVVMRDWHAAEHCPDILARLAAWESLRYDVMRFAQGPEERAELLDNSGLEDDEIAALDTLVWLWNRRTQQERDTMERHG